MTEKTRRIIMGVVGVSLLGVCVAMLRIADFGTDPFTVMVVSVAHKTKLSYQVVYPHIMALEIFQQPHEIGSFPADSV